jgi:hypothetical protein
MKRTNFRPASAALLALALLAPLPSFAIGRDLTPVRIATPNYSAQSYGAAATEKGFLLRWDTLYNSQTRSYGTTADDAGAPRLPASSGLPTSSSQMLLPNGDGYVALSENGITELDAGGAVLRNIVFDRPLFFTRAAFDGTNFFLLAAFVGNVKGYVVDRNGHLLATTTLPVPDSSFSAATDVAASADGGFTVLVGGAINGIYALRISGAGQVMGKIDLFTPGNQAGGYLVSIATNVSGRTVAAWTTSGSAFVHTAALHGGSADPDLILHSGSERTTRIALLPSGGGFILLLNTNVDGTSSQRRVFAIRLDGTGAPREASPTLLLNGSYAAAAATSRTLVLLGYGNEVNGNLIEVSAAITDSGIAPPATYDIVATAVRQMTPSVASDGVDFFGAWIETTSTTTTIMAGRMTRSGLPLDGTGLVVAESSAPPSTFPLYSPSVAFGGGVYLVVFESAFSPEHLVMGRRYARDGTAIDPAPFVITHTGRTPSVAFGGGRFLVAWELCSGVACNVNSLAGATVASDGTEGPEQLLTPALTQDLHEEIEYPERPTIAWNGRHFLVAYDLAQQALSGGPVAWRVRVLRTSPLGTPLDAHTIAAVEGGMDAAIACSDRECVVGSRRGDDIVAAVVHDDAALAADAPKIVANSRRVSFDALAFDGTSYILAWRTGDALIGVARLTRAGEPFGIAIAGAANTIVFGAPPSIAIAANSVGDTAIVTTEFSTVWMIDRARFYLASELPQPRRRAVQ